MIAEGSDVPRRIDRLRIVISMRFGRVRRLTSIYLALFFCAVAVAPHHHINGLEDLVLDQPSNSGRLVLSGVPVGAHGDPGFCSFKIVDDESCLACFTSDFVGAPGHAIAFDTRLDRLVLRATPCVRPSPDEIPSESSSRAPPALS